MVLMSENPLLCTSEIFSFVCFHRYILSYHSLKCFILFVLGIKLFTPWYHKMSIFTHFWLNPSSYILQAWGFYPFVCGDFYSDNFNWKFFAVYWTIIRFLWLWTLYDVLVKSFLSKNPLLLAFKDFLYYA